MFSSHERGESSTAIRGMQFTSNAQRLLMTRQLCQSYINAFVTTDLPYFSYICLHSTHNILHQRLFYFVSLTRENYKINNKTKSIFPIHPSSSYSVSSILQRCLYVSTCRVNGVFVLTGDPYKLPHSHWKCQSCLRQLAFTEQYSLSTFVRSIASSISFFAMYTIIS